MANEQGYDLSHQRHAQKVRKDERRQSAKDCSGHARHEPGAASKKDRDDIRMDQPGRKQRNGRDAYRQQDRSGAGYDGKQIPSAWGGLIMNASEIFDRPIAFQRCFMRLEIGVTGALMLSQAVYWSNRTKKGDGWFYKSREEWEEETGLSRSEQETARRRLVSIGVFMEEKRGVPCTVNYCVNFGKLFSLLSNSGGHSSLQESYQLDGGNPANQNAGFQQTITEITSEITSEKKTLRDQQAERIPVDEIFNVYERVLPTKPRVRIRDDARRKAVRSIWQKDQKFQSVEFWEKYFSVVKESPFLMSQKTFAFDWLMKPANFKKVAEGNYSS